MENIIEALENLNIIIWKYDPLSSITFLSGFASLTEFYTNADMQNVVEATNKILHPEDQESFQNCFHEIKENKPFAIDIRLRNRLGQYKWLHIKGKPYYDQKQNFYMGQLLEKTEQKEIEDKLDLFQGQIMDIINNVPNPIAIHKQREIAYVNPAALAMLGFSDKTEVIGKAMGDFISKGQVKEGDARENKDVLVGSDGTERVIEAKNFTILFNNEPHNLTFGNDITEQQMVKKRLSNLEYYDELTELANTKLLNEKLESYMKDGHPFTLFFIGLNKFKLINTTFGFLIGDEILKKVANRLKVQVAKGDTIFRIEGDKFAYIGTCKTKDQCKKFAQKINKIIGEPIFIQGQEFYISPSIGISFFPEDATDIESLKKNAHTALQLAKEKNRYNIQFYNSDIRDAYERKMTLEKELRKAEKNNELYLHYQPKCCVKTGEVIGAEALLRWSHPELGRVSPVEFIPIAEETGLIESIGEWVIKEACGQIRKWLDQGLDIYVSVNLSVKQLHQPKLVSIVNNAIRKANIPPRNLELEITESIMQQSDDAIDLLHNLKELGVRISIDDFGTGYSSLSYLKNLPIDTLKIDRYFIKDVEDGVKDRAIVKSIVELGHNLKLTVIAEGVETQGQLSYLDEIKCNHAQGYLFSKPLNQVEFIIWLKNNRKLTSHTR